MKKILSLMALVCALTFVPVSTAKAGTDVYYHRPVVHARVVYYGRDRVMYDGITIVTGITVRTGGRIVPGGGVGGGDASFN